MPAFDDDALLLTRAECLQSAMFFFNLIMFCSDTLILETYFFIIRTNNFRGCLSDISAKKSTLLTIPPMDQIRH